MKLGLLGESGASKDGEMKHARRPSLPPNAGRMQQINAQCKSCGHKETMFDFWWHGNNKCLECGGYLIKEGEPTVATKSLMELVRKRNEQK